jgi:hypothetical protein
MMLIARVPDFAPTSFGPTGDTTVQNAPSVAPKSIRAINASTKFGAAATAAFDTSTARPSAKMTLRRSKLPEAR